MMNVGLLIREMPPIFVRTNISNSSSVEIISTGLEDVKHTIRGRWETNISAVGEYVAESSENSNSSSFTRNEHFNSHFFPYSHKISISMLIKCN